MPSSTNIFETTSFNAFDVEAQHNRLPNYIRTFEGVPDLYSYYTQGDINLAGTHYNAQSTEPLLSTADLFENRLNLLIPSTYYITLLKTLNPVMFRYMEDEEKIAHQRVLRHAFHFLSSQYQLDRIEERKQKFKDQSEYIFQCVDLLDELEFRINSLELNGITVSNEEAKIRRIKRYLDLEHFRRATIAWWKFWNKEWWEQKTLGFSRTLIDGKSFINDYRLAWVWANAFIRSVVELCEEERFPGRIQTLKALGALSFFTGYLSWLLYYARLAVNLFVVLKHVIAPSAEEDKNIRWQDRFLYQLGQRKFTLLNDSIWGAANQVCAQWLTGDVVVGTIKDAAFTMGDLGNALTVGLLVMDVALTYCLLYEQRARNKKELARYQNDIAVLQKKIDAIADVNDVTRKRLEHERRLLKDAEAQYKMEWYYTEAKTKCDLDYAWSLLGAFTLMIGGFCPFSVLFNIVPYIGLSFAVTLGLVGAFFCFAGNTYFAAKKSHLAIQQMEEVGYLAQMKRQKLLDAFRGWTSDRDRKKRLFYLEIQQLDSSIEYQNKFIAWEKKQFILTTIVDAISPVTVFFSLMFLPTLPIALGAILSMGLLAALLKKLVNDYQKGVDKVELPKMDDLPDYLFQKNPSTENRNSFFHKPKRLGAEIPRALNLITAILQAEPVLAAA